MSYKTSYWVMRIVGIGGIVIMFFGGMVNQLVAGIIGIACVVGATLQANFFYHCPHCKRDLPRRSLPTKCPYCKKPLN